MYLQTNKNDTILVRFLPSSSSANNVRDYRRLFLLWIKQNWWRNVSWFCDKMFQLSLSIWYKLHRIWLISPHNSSQVFHLHISGCLQAFENKSSLNPIMECRMQLGRSRLGKCPITLSKARTQVWEKDWLERLTSVHTVQLYYKYFILMILKPPRSLI